jgi:hypothetical protein
MWQDLLRACYPCRESLMLGCGIVEVCRLGAMLLLARVHHRENLSSL